jgi:hypothetical protein
VRLQSSEAKPKVRSQIHDDFADKRRRQQLAEEK